MDPKNQSIPNAYENVKSVERVDKLELDALPLGEFSRLFIELVENGIGRPIQVPVVVARGKKDGPIMGVTSALHGNELNGIPVIHNLLQRINLKTLNGTIVCVIAANMPGLLNQQREFSDGIDLNHIMPGKPNGKLSQVYAHELVERITKHFDYLIDLHTASGGRVNSLYIRANLQQTTTAQMAFSMRPQIVVHNPASDHTLRGVAAEDGKPAITVEVCDPQRFQRDPIKRTLQGIRRVLNIVGMVPKKSGSASKPKPPVLCSRSYWVLAERGGLINVVRSVAQYVTKGDLIATQVNIFGDLIREYHAPEDGIVIGHATNPIGQTGERILHLGILMSEAEKLEFEKVSKYSLEGEDAASPGEQDIPSLKPQ